MDTALGKKRGSLALLGKKKKGDSHRPQLLLRERAET